MSHTLLSATVNDVIGTIQPPVDDPLYKAPVDQALSKLIMTGINLFLFVAGIAALIYLMWGAFDWISSNGEKDKLTKAQAKIQSAAIGLVLAVVVLTLFNVIMGTVLGGKFGIGENFVFTLPHL